TMGCISHPNNGWPFGKSKNALQSSKPNVIMGLLLCFLNQVPKTGRVETLPAAKLVHRTISHFRTSD
ncbi:MAG: hypothetical protein RR085_11030, partial [Clostridia bacterium]